MKTSKILIVATIFGMFQVSCANKDAKATTVDAEMSMVPEQQSPQTDTDTAQTKVTVAGNKFDNKKSNIVSTPQANGFLLFSDINGLDKNTHTKLKQLNVQRFLRLGSGLIDKDEDGYFDEESVKKKVENYFPNSESQGYCVINWERDAFEKLKGRRSKRDFEIATSQYIELIKFIRKLRPKVKISVYNIPFRHNTISSKGKKFDNSTTDRILKEVDFLSPSLYMLYSVNDVTLEKNKDYLSQNLTRTFKLADGRPVIPYIGYRVYSNESVDSNEYLSKDEFRSYVEHIKSFRYKGDGVDGFIVFNGDHQSFKDKKRSFKTKNISEDQFVKEFNQTALNYFTIVSSVK